MPMVNCLSLLHLREVVEKNQKGGKKLLGYSRNGNEWGWTAYRGESFFRRAKLKGTKAPEGFLAIGRIPGN